LSYISSPFPNLSGRKNDLGLFDMHGNVYTWCQERHQDYAAAKGDGASEDKEDDLDVDSKESRVLRGGSFNYHAVYARCANRNWNVPTNRFTNVGFRPASTLPCPNPQAFSLRSVPGCKVQAVVPCRASSPAE
jgi:formylglycine-generating enzyme required for sulfatase activity